VAGITVLLGAKITTASGVMVAFGRHGRRRPTIRGWICLNGHRKPLMAGLRADHDDASQTDASSLTIR
jgi:hypothetical protein